MFTFFYYNIANTRILYIYQEMPTTPENMKLRIIGNMCDNQSESIRKKCMCFWTIAVLH